MAAPNAHPTVTNADPHWVGSTFVSKYYDVLASHPEFLHRFYKEGSTLSIVDMQNDSIGARVADSQAIQDLVNSTVAGARANTKHVDAQFSVQGGVLLQVVGTFQLQGQERPFNQTFFLATQENGFYVHNDMLRVYPASTAVAHSNGNHVKPAPHAVPVPAAAAPAAAAAPVPDPNVKAPAKAQPRSQAASPAPPAAATTPTPPPQARTATPQPEPAAPSPPPPHQPPSWAALVKHKDTPGKTPPPTPSPAPPQPSSVGREAAPEPPASSAPQANGGSYHGSSHEPTPHVYPHCVIVRGLPQEHVPQEVMEKEFSKFGALKRGGAVTVHNQGRELGKVAYIKFEDAAGVEAALQATDLVIAERTLTVERWEGPLPSYNTRGGPGRGSFRGGRSGPMGPGRGPYNPEYAGRGGGRGGDRPQRTERRPSGGPGSGGPPSGPAPGGRTGGSGPHSGRGGRGPRREDGAPASQEARA